jgi:hypothetical protein
MIPQTPEARLLCLCSVDPLSDERRARIREAVEKGLDWTLFCRLASYHRVFAPAHKNLSLSASGAVPDGAVEVLRDLYFKNLAWSLAAEKDLVRLLQALAEAGIEAVPYKGPVLAETAYGDIGLRRFNDLDILIPRAVLERAAFVLGSLGYTSGLPQNPARLRRLERVLRDFAFRRPVSSCPVEVQWRLTQRYHPLFREPEVEWTRLREETLSGFPVRTLSWPDTILVLCHHGLYHSWEYLQMVADVAQSVRAAAAAGGLDWPALLDEARRRGALRTLLLGLLLARDLLELGLPDEVQRAARRDPFVEGLSIRLSAGFFGESSYIRKARSFFFLEARMIGGFRNRARYLWGRLMTPNEEDRQALELPGLLYPFHPVLRLARLFEKYIWKRDQRLATRH